MYATVLLASAFVAAISAQQGGLWQSFIGGLKCPEPGETQGRTWSDVEVCAKQRAEYAVTECIRYIQNVAARQALKTCIDTHKQEAFALYDSCLQKNSVCKTKQCTSWGNADDTAKGQTDLKNRVHANIRPTARQALDCFNGRTTAISVTCRQGCATNLGTSALGGGDKVKACYQNVGNAQRQSFANCINEVNAD